MITYLPQGQPHTDGGNGTDALRRLRSENLLVQLDFLEGIDDLRFDPRRWPKSAAMPGIRAPPPESRILLDVFRTKGGAEIVDRPLDFGTDRIGIGDQSLPEAVPGLFVVSDPFDLGLFRLFKRNAKICGQRLGHGIAAEGKIPREDRYPALHRIEVGDARPDIDENGHIVLIEFVIFLVHGFKGKGIDIHDRRERPAASMASV